MQYSKELKDSIIRRMLPPSNEAISKISKEEGISEQTLRNWRDNARANGIAAPGNNTLSDKWSTQDKFLIVVETASMNEIELAEYARQKGLYVDLRNIISYSRSFTSNYFLFFLLIPD
ncbi:Transposase [Anaerobium acetethylicum]|uniref:Transposase n=2 Tax=Anaerobium acetethylicum TaxID=1619234 RepID=A0A1D3TWB8_9FIRM|nr:Transposase [Anaerobium acetethylicum]